jgi:predicted acetyltransferase
MGIQPERNILVGVADGAVVSQALIHEFEIWIEGTLLPMGGLANVATVPEHTRRGFARRVVQSTLGWMRTELGCPVSMLYPTLPPLYLGLGWAYAHASVHLEGPPAAFQPAPLLPSDPGGRIVRRPPEPADADQLEPIYRQFATPRSCYVKRTDWLWQRRLTATDRAGRSNWLALWYGSDGQLSGYLLYTLGTDSSRSLRVRELFAIRPEAYQGLLAFLGTHHLWERIELEAGEDVPWLSMVKEPHSLQATQPIRHQFMFRIVDLPAALAAREVGRSESPITLQISDAAAPWNDGVWRIASEPGETGARWVCQKASTERPKASADIATVSRLYSGYLTVSQAIDAGFLRAADDARPTLEALFRRSYRPHSEDYF